LGTAVAQQKSLAEQLLGTWILVSHQAVRKDGSTFLPYGPNPQGIAIFEAGNRFIITVMRSDRPKYAIGLPSKGTAEENKQTAEGTMTYFGTYLVNEVTRAIAIHIDASSFPNWSGTDQVREFAIAGDQLTLTARALATGGHADVVWKRAQ
jgi:Lipocalin-like domain